ncbi:MAG: hypothetical protein J6112_07040 [Clostridia bacterium]|nr:hypothetical protein [Clostridia bacterium]
MKKYRFAAAAAILLTLAMVFSGCVNTPSHTDPEPTQEATAAPTEEPEATHPPAKENLAKVILIMGQSNAVGASLYSPLKDILEKERYDKLLKNGFENVRIVYYAGEDSATNYPSEKRLATTTVAKLFDKVKFGKSLTGAQFGLEVGMAEYLEEQHPDDTYYIIKVARGGESLNPKFTEGGVLFEKAMTMIEGCFSILKKEGLNPEIISICWMQGENEAGTKATAENYIKDLEKMVEALRRRLADYAPWGGIPFIDGGISSHWTYYKTVNNIKKDFAERSDNNYFIDSIALGLTFDKEPKGNPDLAHFDSESMLILGREFAKSVDLAYEKVK